MKDFTQGSAYSDVAFRYLMTTWIVRHHRPFAIVDNPPLREAFTMLYAKAKVPSANTVSRDVCDVHEISKVAVISMLKVCNSNYSLTKPC